MAEETREIAKILRKRRPQPGEGEIEALKKELEKLREENKRLREELERLGGGESREALGKSTQRGAGEKNEKERSRLHRPRWDPLVYEEILREVEKGWEIEREMRKRLERIERYAEERRYKPPLLKTKEYRELGRDLRNIIQNHIPHHKTWGAEERIRLCRLIKFYKLDPWIVVCKEWGLA